MKRLFGLLTVSLLLAAAGLHQVSAQQGTLSEAHTQRIRSNCNQALQTLQQLHSNDLPIRVNRGQAYDSISTKLMARFNSRLALNKLDGSSLLTITSRYDDALTSFRSSYIRYDSQMAATLRIDCTKQPVAFYDAVVKTRALRATVNGHVKELHKYIDEYRTTFDASTAAYLKQTGTTGQ